MWQAASQFLWGEVTMLRLGLWQIFIITFINCCGNEMSVAVKIWLRCDPQCTAISCCFLPGLSWRIHDDLCTLYCSPGMCSMFISVADDTWEQDYWISLHPSQHPSHTVTCPGHMTRAALLGVDGRVLQFFHFVFFKVLKVLVKMLCLCLNTHFYYCLISLES